VNSVSLLTGQFTPKFHYKSEKLQQYLPQHSGLPFIQCTSGGVTYFQYNLPGAYRYERVRGRAIQALER